MSRDASHILGRWLAIAAIVVVASSLIAAVWIMGSPATQRQANIDNRRIADLRAIEGMLNNHVTVHQALPPDLTTLSEQPGQRLSIVDPVNGAPYEYEVIGERTYRLCAVFVTDSAEIPATAGQHHPMAWAHGAGRQCFDRRAK